MAKTNKQKEIISQSSKEVVKTKLKEVVDKTKPKKDKVNQELPEEKPSLNKPEKEAMKKSIKEVDKKTKIATSEPVAEKTKRKTAEDVKTVAKSIKDKDKVNQELPEEKPSLNKPEKEAMKKSIKEVDKKTKIATSEPVAEKTKRKTAEDVKTVAKSIKDSTANLDAKTSKKSATPDIETTKAAKEIKNAIKKSPAKTSKKSKDLEAALVPVQKPVVKKSADELETELINKKKVPEQELTKTKGKAEKKITVVKEKEPVAAAETKKHTAGKPNKQEKTLSDEVPNKAQNQSTTQKEIRYSDAELQMFENVILEAKRESLDELRMLRDRLDDLNSYDMAEESMIYSMHMGEQGTEPIEKEKTYAQIQRLTEYIKKLDDALQRIKDKTYGICRVCGILIAKERLLAVPITTLSASWKIHQKCPEDNIDRIEPMKE
jgi:RNA polymerase-binding transcription factor DksA